MKRAIRLVANIGLKDYDRREFHDAVLKNDAMPVQILKEVINAYIKS
jgi:uncharacterized protein (DUF885 family)